MTILEDVTRKAKKTHNCQICNKKIEKGEQYKLIKFVDCGEFYTSKYHIDCRKAAYIALDYFDYGYDDDITESDVQDLITDMACEISKDDVNRPDFMNISECVEYILKHEEDYE